jgi:hypothetical protein
MVLLDLIPKTQLMSYSLVVCAASGLEHRLLNVISAAYGTTDGVLAYLNRKSVSYLDLGQVGYVPNAQTACPNANLLDIYNTTNPFSTRVL